MAILRKKKRDSYTVIDNAVFMDDSLSMKAKGMLCQMLSLPDYWTFSVEGLATLFRDGKTSVQSALNELEEAGYFRREQIKDGGKFAGIEYIVSETKMTDSPYTDFLHTENPHPEIPPQLNTNKSNTNKSTTIKSFKRPTIEEVAAYINEMNYHINAEVFMDYYEANGWKVGRLAMKDWKATVRNWERRRKENEPNAPSAF